MKPLNSGHISLQLSETLAKNGSKLLLTHGDPKEECSIVEMDSAVAAIQLLSPLVDDLASDLPAPLDLSQTKKQVSGKSNEASNKYVHVMTTILGKIFGFAVQSSCGKL